MERKINSRAFPVASFLLLLAFIGGAAPAKQAAPQVSWKNQQDPMGFAVQYPSD